MDQLLILNIPPELEDQLVDYLLSLDDLNGFTSYPARGHGEHRQMSVAEKVTGRRRRIQFELILDHALADRLLAGLRDNVGTDIYYWLQPVAASGHI